MSSELPGSVVDTVVLMYFLMVDEVQLLFELLGDPLAVPRIVFDPDEPVGVAEGDTLCEISRSILHHRRVSQDPARDEDAQETAARSADRLAATKELQEGGRLVVMDLTADERDLFGRLIGREGCSEFGLRFPLDPGEAACLALAVSRGLTLATDDGDALTALASHASGHPYQRIRRLLIDAGQGGLRTKAEANETHRKMQQLGFWDKTLPFPTE